MSTTTQTGKIGLGFWAAASLNAETPFKVEYNSGVAAYWVVLRRGDWEEPSLFESQAGGPLRPAIP